MCAPHLHRQPRLTATPVGPEKRRSTPHRTHFPQDSGYHAYVCIRSRPSLQAGDPHRPRVSRSDVVSHSVVPAHAAGLNPLLQRTSALQRRTPEQPYPHATKHDAVRTRYFRLSMPPHPRAQQSTETRDKNAKAEGNGNFPPAPSSPPPPVNPQGFSTLPHRPPHHTAPHPASPPHGLPGEPEIASILARFPPRRQRARVDTPTQAGIIAGVVPHGRRS
jgi:hypothetical protein